MNSLLETFNYPPTLHALVVHFPVVLALLGAPLVLLALLLPRWRAGLWAAVVLYVAVAGAGYLAMGTGEAAREIVPPTAGADIGGLIDSHESWGETIWIAALVTAVLLLLGAVLHERVRLICLLLALASSLATAGITGVTAHRGGRLVYVHGVGTQPFMNQLIQTETAEQPLDADIIEAPQTDEPDTALDVPEEPAATAEPEAAVEETAEQPLVDTEPAQEAAAGVQAYTYANDIAPVLAGHCVKCHDAEEPASDLALERYEDLFQDGKKGGRVVVAGDPDGSSIIKYIEGTFQPQMPRKADPLDAETIAVIRQWIAAGAPEG
jgi:uncharacterized membrane protein/mono/diheme cytochrome c family protein